MKSYTVVMHPPENENQLWGAWCKELSLMASGENENEAFYNLVENIPIYFQIHNEKERTQKLRSEKSDKPGKKVYRIPAFA